MKLYDETDCLPHVKPAFPVPVKRSGNDLDGLTKREYAAIHIAAAIAGRKETYVNADSEARMAVALADAVLREAGE